MAEGDRTKWNEQHSAQHHSQEPSNFLKEVLQSNAWQIPRGRALDVATGTGRNALFLAEQGFDVTAIDISAVALAGARATAAAKGLTVDWQEADLESADLGQESYLVIVNINYLQRSLVPQIKRALQLGGFIIFETYLIDQRAIGHPKNTDYLLEHNELLELFCDFRIFYYREGRFAEGNTPAFRAGLFAQKIS